MDRCITCDSRYCPPSHCAADFDARGTSTKAYVAGRGYVDLDTAYALYLQGRLVDWPQSPAWDILAALGRRGWSPTRDRLAA